MYYNGNNRYPINNFLINVVHKHFEEMYPKNTQQEDNAKKIQSFLQNLKEFTLTRNTDLSEAKVYEEIIKHLPQDIVQDLFTWMSPDNTQYNKQGTELEKQLSAVIREVFEIDNKQKIDLGTESISTGIGDHIEETLHNLPLEILQKYGPDIKAKVAYSKAETDEARINLFKFSDVQGKIDLYVPNNAEIKMKYTQNIDFTLSDDTKKALNALKGGKYSIKSYRTSSAFKLGTTNVLRVVFTILHSIPAVQTSETMKNYTASSAIQHSINKIAGQGKDWQTTAAHIYHMRFIYELTGHGTTYKDSSLAGLSDVDYIILNNPNGGPRSIYVKGTNELIRRALSSKTRSHNPFDVVKIEPPQSWMQTDF